MPDANNSPQGRGIIQMNNIKFSQKVIDDIVENSEDFAKAFLAFYRLAIPDFDNVRQIKGFPVVSDLTAEYCLDKLHTKTDDAWAVNSLWLNKGFSSNDPSVPDWEISTKAIELIY